VAIATSAGGLKALRELLSSLPADFPAAVLIAMHRGPSGPDNVSHLIASWTALSVRAAAAPGRLARGCVVLAPPGRHLELTADWGVRAERNDRVNYYCPSADVLFESVARHASARAIGCVLTGSGTDGVAGARAIRARGGFVIAQSPRSADFPHMPQAAIESGKVDLVLPLRDIAYALCTLTAQELQAA
jgi:two-component system chemotaxis response regulator CheB